MISSTWSRDTFWKDIRICKLYIVCLPNLSHLNVDFTTLCSKTNKGKEGGMGVKTRESWANVLFECLQTTYSCAKTKLHQNENVRNFLLHLVIFCSKFDLYNMAFQCLFSQIIRIWELFFWPVGGYFSCKFYAYNRKPFFLLKETNFFLLSVHPW